MPQMLAVRAGELVAAVAVAALAHEARQEAVALSAGLASAARSSLAAGLAGEAS